MNVMKLPLLVFLLTLAIPLGCQDRTAAEPSLSDAERVFIDSLQAWQSGKSPADLRAGDPPVFVADDRWQSGKQLSSYKLLDGSRIVGSSVHMKAELAFGRSKEISKYVVTTAPAYTIAQAD